jgi:hypothetical protein
MSKVKVNQLTYSDKTAERMDVYITFPTINLITWNQWLSSYGFEKGFLKWSLCCLVLWVYSNKFWVFLHLHFGVLFSCPLAYCATLRCKMFIQGITVWIYNNYMPYESVDNTPASIFVGGCECTVKIIFFTINSWPSYDIH